jgi:ABC-type transport system involved in cytochrome c biogenesis ATPase subunit
MSSGVRPFSRGDERRLQTFLGNLLADRSNGCSLSGEIREAAGEHVGQRVELTRGDVTPKHLEHRRQRTLRVDAMAIAGLLLEERDQVLGAPDMHRLDSDRVASGVFFGLLGSNGAGKSTTIKMMTTLLPPTSGSARVVGFDIVRQARQVRRRIGYVPQMLSADAGRTGRENLMMLAKLYDVPASERALRVADALAFMGLSDVGSKLVRTYSGGMIRRLEIAQALLHRPSTSGAARAARSRRSGRRSTHSATRSPPRM